MGFPLPSILKEVYIPIHNEQELIRSQGTYLSSRSKPQGDVVVTTERVSFLSEPIGIIRVGTEEVSLQTALVNIGYSSYISANIKLEKKLFMKEELLEINYEAVGGLARKALFKIRDKGQTEEVLRNVEIAAIKYREKSKESLILPMNLFTKFAEFLGVNKAIRPLYYDSVTRCIAIPSSFFCIKDADWNIDGSPDIVNKAKSWVLEFKDKMLKRF